MKLLHHFFHEHTPLVQKEISSLILQDLFPLNQRLQEAMHYSSTGGKCIRGNLIVLSGQLVKHPFPLLYTCAAIIEMIHAFSLIHDDLPALDNDSVRRGKPTAHIQYDEATAILSGDALLNLAYYHLIRLDIQASIRCSLMQSFSLAIHNMIQGQMLDIHGDIPTYETMCHMHSLKTGALIAWSTAFGAHLIQDASLQHLLENYGNLLGLLFQFTDDILDHTQSSKILGKTAQKDLKTNKQNLLYFADLAEANRKADDLLKKILTIPPLLLEAPPPILQLFEEFPQFIRNRVK